MPEDLTPEQLLENLSVKIPAPAGTTRENAEPEMLISALEMRTLGLLLGSYGERLAVLEAGGGGGGALPFRDAVLIVGQSEQEGTGGELNVSPQSDITPSVARQYQRARILNPSTLAFEKLQFGVNNLGAYRDSTSGLPYSFGPELPTAQYFEDKYPNAPHAIDIVKSAKGGRQIEHWDKNNPAGSHPGASNDGGGYQEVVAFIDATVAAHLAEGYTTRWLYVDFNQGQNASSNWGTQLKAFRTNLINDGKIPASLIWMNGRVSGPIGLEQDQVALDLPGIFISYPTFDAVLNSDLVHFKGRTYWVLNTRLTNLRFGETRPAPFPMADVTTATPTTLAAGTVTANSVAWNWTAGSAISILKRSTTADFSADVVEVFNNVGGTVTAGGLSAETPYYWRLTQQESGKLISAPQAVTQATPAASGGAGVSIVNDPNQTGAGSFWQASGNPEFFAQSSGSGLTTSAPDNNPRSWDQPVNKLKEPFIVGTSYRMRLVVTSAAGIIAQTKFSAIQNSPAIGSPGTYDIDFVATDAGDYPAPIFYGSNVVRTIDVFKLPA